MGATSASVTFSGGLGISENIITASDGLGVSKNLYVGDMLIVEDDTEASNATSASFATNGGIYAAKDVIVNGDLVTSEITSSSGSDLEITSNGIPNITSASGSDIAIESGGNMTLQSDKLTVETQSPSSTSTLHISLLDGYMNIMKKQISVTDSFSTFATIELSYLKSCHVKVVLEGNWANNPALGTFEFLVMHNGGSDPEPGATNTSDSSQ